MGAYNIVTISTVCALCKQASELKVQFKYGDTWQHEYRLGDTLKWGGNDIGEPHHRRVVVDGVAEQCAKCHGSDERDYVVFLENDTISIVEPLVGQYDFTRAGKNYIVLED